MWGRGFHTVSAFGLEPLNQKLDFHKIDKKL